MKKTFIKFLPLMAAVMLTTSCSKDEDTNASQQPEIKGIPFAIKVNMSQKLTKLGFVDNGTNITVPFEDADVNNLYMYLYSNEKTQSGWGKYSYGHLILTDINGVFTGTLSSMYGAPDDGEELLAIIRMNEYSDVNESSTSFEDLLQKCGHQFEGTFKFDAQKGATHITNPEDQGNQYYTPIYEFGEIIDENDNKDTFLPTVNLTDQKTYFEFNFPDEDNISIGTSDFINDQEIEPYSYQSFDISSNHKLWIALDAKYQLNQQYSTVYRFIVNNSKDQLIYSKLYTDMLPGVLYSVTRPQQN